MCNLNGKGRQRRWLVKIANSLIFYTNVNLGPSLHDLYLSQLESQLEEVDKMDLRKEIAEERLKEVIKNDYQKMDEANQTLRQQASQLMGTTNTIPMYTLWSLLRVVPKRKDIIKASSGLISLSNSTGGEGIGRREREEDIAKRLRIKVLSERFKE